MILKKKLLYISGLISTFVILWLIAVIIKNDSSVLAYYNIRSFLFIFSFVLGEILFDTGIILMIYFSKIVKINKKSLLNFDFKHVNLQDSKVFYAFILNRLGTFIMPLYLLIVSRLSLPIFISILLFISISLSIALILMVYITEVRVLKNENS